MKSGDAPPLVYYRRQASSKMCRLLRLDEQQDHSHWKKSHPDIAHSCLLREACRTLKIQPVYTVALFTTKWWSLEKYSSPGLEPGRSFS
ncbi:hypothetical protein X798_00438 [Onchocerca flexuosa]|nr:hypothetical protein X798_00438 [Onchocerca flexuosa]